MLRIAESGSTVNQSAALINKQLHCGHKALSQVDVLKGFSALKFSIENMTFLEHFFLQIQCC